jgi:hypothetical protein
MRLPLLLLLALPLSAAAQMNGSSFGNSQFQASQRQAQMSMDFQRRTMERSMSRMNSASGPQRVKLDADQKQQVAKQHEAEQKATVEFSRLARRQDSLRLVHPAPNALQTAARKKADEQALALLTVRNYRDVFLPGQVMAAEQARSLPAKGMEEWQNINKDLQDNAWWSKQDPAQLLEKVTAYRTTLTSLTTALLGFEPATAPKPQKLPSTSPLDAMVAKGPFDPQVATQFVQEAARVEKGANSTKLVSAINDFNRDLAEAAARPEFQQNPQKMRNTVKSSLNDLNKGMARYELEMGQSRMLDYAEITVNNYMAKYLPKNEKAKKRAS